MRRQTKRRNLRTVVSDLLDGDEAASVQVAEAKLVVVLDVLTGSANLAAHVLLG